MLIEINLLPQEFKKETPKDASDIIRKAIYAIPVVVFLLLVIHGYLAVSGIIFNLQYGSLEKKWNSLESHQKEFEVLNKEYSSFTKDVSTVQEFMKERINWSEKLNKLSLLLPPGIWFEELQVNGKEFTIHGSVFSLQKQELELINKFLGNLKNDKGFYGDFIGLELASVKRETISSYTLLTFVLTGTLK